ncbi:hypothetical protein [Micromonospora aurantiaca (nom. illeg.)]|uniref:hypothetical protein n=1 Tax=Micromonospora aurantiaca (nom. illeg.) TaxID=47850 RepID=UPI0033F05E8C
MTYVGQRETMRLEVRDEEGLLSDATVTLTLTRPDGTTALPEVSHDDTGKYSAQVTYDQAGGWLRVWQTTGTVVSVDADQLHVAAPELQPVTLAELKKQLNRSDRADDLELQVHLDAAIEVVEDLVGPLTVREFTETHCGPTLALNRRPLVSVMSVTGPGGLVLNDGLYTVDTAAGTLTARWGARQDLTVVYRAGWSTIPAAYRLAVLIIAQHLWQTQHGGGGRVLPGDDTIAMPGMGFAIPSRAVELLTGGMLPGIA